MLNTKLIICYRLNRDMFVCFFIAIAFHCFSIALSLLLSSLSSLSSLFIASFICSWLTSIQFSMPILGLILFLVWIRFFVLSCWLKEGLRSPAYLKAYHASSLPHETSSASIHGARIPSAACGPSRSPWHILVAPHDYWFIVLNAVSMRLYYAQTVFAASSVRLF